MCRSDSTIQLQDYLITRPPARAFLIQDCHLAERLIEYTQTGQFLNTVIIQTPGGAIN